jgi:hypothetical protein
VVMLTTVHIADIVARAMHSISNNPSPANALLQMVKAPHLSMKIWFKAVERHPDNYETKYDSLSELQKAES